MELTIAAQSRTVVGKQNEKLRESGMIPAVLYGRGKETVSLQLAHKEFEKIYRQAGENTLINLLVNDKPHKVLIHDVAKHYMKDEPIHVDFYEVDLTRKIHAKVPLEFTGVASAVKELGGIMVKNLNEIEVEAMPADLPHKIEINLEGLKTFSDIIRISDIKVSGDVKVLGRADEVIVAVQAPISEEDLANLEQPVSAEAEKATIEAMNKEAESAKADKAGEEGETKTEGKVEAKADKVASPAEKQKK